MNFLNPWVLWGLFATGIPIIIHLISLRKTRKVEFSMVSFIKELEKETIRRLKLKQWILLLLRTLAIALLVLALSRPVIRGYFPLSSQIHQTPHIVAIVDNSASMSSMNERKTSLDRSKKQLLSLLSSTEKNSFIDLYQSSPFKRILSLNEIILPEIESALQEIDHSNRADNLWSILGRTIQDVESRQDLRPIEMSTEMFVLSDFSNEPPTDWKFPENLNPARWKFLFFTASFSGFNSWISDVTIPTVSRLVGKPISIRAELATSSMAFSEPLPVELYIKNQKVGQISVKGGKKESSDVFFQPIVESAGNLEGKVSLNDDDYPNDNQYFFTFTVPEKIHVGLLGYPSRNTHLVNALAAINAERDLLNIVHEPFEQSSSFENLDVVILNDPRTDDLAEGKIKRMVKNGGSVVVFLGDKFEPSQGNGNFLFPQGDNIITTARGAFFKATASEAGKLIFSDSYVKQLENELPEVHQYIRLRKADQWTPLLELKNGDPLLLMRRTFEGNLFLFTALPNTDWMDLPLKGLFVPMLHRILTDWLMDEMAVSVQDSLSVQLPNLNEGKMVEVVTPSGKSIRLPYQSTEEGVIIPSIDELGFYHIFSDGKPIRTFASNLPESENPFSISIKEKILKKFPNDSWLILNENDPIIDLVSEFRHGKEISMVLLFFACCILGIEVWLGRITKK